MFAKSILVVTMVSTVKSEPYSLSLVDARVSHLLENITHCDLQIVHDGTDFGNHNIPVKVIWIPAYLNQTLYNPSSPAINILSSRTSQHKFSLFLPKVLIETKFVSEFEKSSSLAWWLSIAVLTHLYYVVTEFVLLPTIGKVRKRFHQYGNMFIIVVAAKQKQDLNHLLPLADLSPFSNSYTLVASYLASDNRTHEICGIPQSIILNGATWADCRIIIDWDERLDIVAKWSNQWLLSTPKLSWEPNNKFDIRQPTKNKINPFDRKENYTMQDLIASILSDANVTAKHILANMPPSQIPTLEFSYKLGNEDFIYFEMFEIIHQALPFTAVITRTTGFQYLSCYRERYQTFEIYISPFRPELWLTLLITLVHVIALTWH